MNSAVVVISDDEAPVVKRHQRLPELPPQEFSPELVKWLLASPNLPKLSPEATRAMGEVLTVLVKEATLRAKAQAEEEEDDTTTQLHAKHLFAILPKLLLDF